MPGWVTLRPVLQRLLLILFGFAAMLAAAEVCLQLGGIYVEATGRRNALTWLTGNLRLLSMGDSNTYGLQVSREDAYPQVVERLWNEDAELPRIEVMNLGWPGTNSSELRRHYERWLTIFRPDVVTVMIGANDSWSIPLSDDDGLGASTEPAWWKHFRVYRLLRLIRRSFEEWSLEAKPIDFEGDVVRSKTGRRVMGGGEIRYGEESIELGWRASPEPVREWRTILKRNLAAFGDLAAAADAKLVLITYPSGSRVYGATNRAIREVAAERELPLIELEAEFRERCPDWVCKELRRDQHATPVGYELAGEIITRNLQKLLDLAEGLGGIAESASPAGKQGSRIHTPP
jgi:hypothetical protein